MVKLCRASSPTVIRPASQKGAPGSQLRHPGTIRGGVLQLVFKHHILWSSIHPKSLRSLVFRKYNFYETRIPVGSSHTQCKPDSLCVLSQIFSWKSKIICGVPTSRTSVFWFVPKDVDIKWLARRYVLVHVNSEWLARNVGTCWYWMVGTQVRAQHGEEEDSQSAKEQHAKSPPETCGESCSLTNICKMSLCSPKLLSPQTLISQ